MDGLRDQLARLKDSFLSSDHCHSSVNDMLVISKPEVIAVIERLIPTDNLDLGQCVSEISCKATKTIGFLRRNLADT